VGLWAGWLTAVAGAWFAIGPIVSRLWTADGLPQNGTPVAASTTQQVVEEIGLFTGLGVVIVFLAATAIGRFSVVGVREAALAETAASAPAGAVAADETSRMRTADTMADERPRRRGWLFRNDRTTRAERAEENRME
jgi:hypothetical protein